MGKGMYSVNRSNATSVGVGGERGLPGSEIQRAELKGAI
jgi:hypothetical protein